MQHLDHKELDRQLEDAALSSDGEFSSNEIDVACLVDDLAGQPLSKSVPRSDASVSSNMRRRLSKGRIVFVIVALLIFTSLLCSLLAFDKIPSSKAGAGNTKALRYRRLFSLILDFQITKRENLENEDAPQAKALHWLAYKDNADDIEDLRIRFSLATLYFSTLSNMTSWRKETNWLANLPVCDWYGVACLETQANVHLVQSLNLSMNGLDGTIPDEVALLQNDCEVLDLSYNSLRGSIPSAIGDNMHNLKRLYLGPNPLASTIPESLYELRLLSHFYIDSSQLHGTISKRIGNLKNLQGLGLHENHLTGVLPESLGSLANLRVLNVDDNLLEGPIPSSLGALTNLVDLRLDHNDLTGSIPRSFADLVLFEILYLNNNHLVGKIPNIVAENLPLLTELHLHNNGFTGTVPSGFAMAPFLEIIYVDGNEFTGSIPEAICDRRDSVGGPLKDLWADCAHPRKVDCREDCCTRCVPKVTTNP